MTEGKIIVGNYNMSWFTGDTTKDVPMSPYSGYINGVRTQISEYPWVRYIYDMDAPSEQPEKNAVISTQNVALRCKYWLNALNHLQKFIETNKPGMVGLQEININHENTIIDNKQKFPEFGSLINQPKMVDELVGSKRIETMLYEVNRQKNSNYKLLCGRVVSFGAWVGICIIYDETQVGAIMHTKIIDNPNQPGRPLLMAITDKGFLLASMHGAQDGTLSLNDGYDKGHGAFNTYIIEKNQKFFERECLSFITETNATIRNCFLATDLNDRYDAVQKLNVNGLQMSYHGDAPITTAPNWDSAAPGRDNFASTENKIASTAKPDCLTKTKNRVSSDTVEMNEEDKTKYPFLTCDNPADKSTDQGVHVLTINHATVDNYLYRGDKVFGTNHDTSSNIVIFVSPEEIGGDRVSRASDHRLVYASFNVSATDNVTTVGGRRTRRHKKRVYNCYKRTHRQHKTRKTRKKTHVNKYKK